MTYAFILTLLALFPEFLRAHREEYWRGWTTELAIGALVGAFLYFVYYAISIGVLRRALAKAPLIGEREALRDSVAAALPAAALWVLFPVLWEDMQPRFVVVFAGLHVAFIAALAARSWFSEEAQRRIVAALAIGLTTSLMAIGAIATLYFIDHWTRHAALTKIPIVWLAVATALLCLAAVIPQRRIPVFTILALLALAVWPVYHGINEIRLATNGAALDSEQPNLLLVTVDTLRADYTSTYGGQIEMSALDSLANEGVVFEKHYSAAPWTMPSMGALFKSRPATSLTPGLPVTRWLAEIRQYEMTGPTPFLAEVLRDKGYSTGGFSANQLLSNQNGIFRGFAVDRFLGHEVPEVRTPLRSMPFLQDIVVALGLVTNRPLDTTDAMERLGKTFLDRQTDTPWFLWLHFMDPHSPYDPPASYRTLDGPWKVWAPLRPEWGSPPASDDRVQPELPQDEVDYVRSLYEAEMRYVNDGIQRVLDRVKAMGEWDNTIVCLTSDHGEEFKDHGGWLHGGTMYNEMLRVPLIIRAPGIAAGRLPQPIASIDVMPTLADLLGAEKPDEWKGQSWAATLRDPNAPPPTRPIIAQGTDMDRPNPLQAVIDGDQKLIQRVDADPANERLFDLIADPNEMDNLAPTEPGEVSRLKTLIEALEQTFNARFTEEETQSTPEEDAAMQQRLESLGYL